MVEISTKSPLKCHSYSHLPNITTTAKHVKPEIPKNPRPKQEHRFICTHKQQTNTHIRLQTYFGTKPKTKILFFLKPPNLNTKSLEPPQQT